jgi:hypothetical protein
MLTLLYFVITPPVAVCTQTSYLIMHLPGFGLVAATGYAKAESTESIRSIGAEHDLATEFAAQAR